MPTTAPTIAPPLAPDGNTAAAMLQPPPQHNPPLTPEQHQHHLAQITQLQQAAQAHAPTQPQPL
eukprot:11925064-Karenia_brevis.AAC.1